MGQHLQSKLGNISTLCQRLWCPAKDSILPSINHFFFALSTYHPSVFELKYSGYIKSIYPQQLQNLINCKEMFQTLPTKETRNATEHN